MNEVLSILRGSKCPTRMVAWSSSSENEDTKDGCEQFKDPDVYGVTFVILKQALPFA